MFVLSIAMLLQPIAAENQQERDDAAQKVQIEASSTQLFALANAEVARGNEALAEKILLALLSDPTLQNRNEARFRLALLASQRGDLQRAGRFLRAVLDEEPGAQRARLELAGVQARMGDLDSSRRTLREVQSGPLPPYVAQMVERFANSLRDNRPFGLNVQVALAPDSNVNRATRSSTLGTIFGDFTLDAGSRETSGVGVKTVAETYAARPLSEDVSILARLGFSSDLYRDKQFNDVLLQGTAGPEFSLLGGRASVLAGAQRRWYGGSRFSQSIIGQLQWQRPLGRRDFLRVGIDVSDSDYRLNKLQDARSIGGSFTYERALEPGTGASVTLGASRQMALDPAYSSINENASVAVWREFGRTTAFVAATVAKLKADERLSIYPERQKENFLRLTAGATLRAWTWQNWAPQVKVIHESNTSPIEIYRYKRWRGEFGFARAF